MTFAPQRYNTTMNNSTPKRTFAIDTLIENIAFTATNIETVRSQC